MRTMKGIPEVRGYRVDLKLAATGTFIEYTSFRQPVNLLFAESLGRGLERQGATYRIVSVTGKERTTMEFVKIIKEWSPSNVPN